MKDISSILVVSELNKESYEALLYGITLGLMFHARVSCIHVLKPSPIDLIKDTLPFGSTQYKDALVEAKVESQNILGHIIDVIARELGIGEVEMNLKIVSGSMKESILQYADEIDANLVVVSTEAGTKFLRNRNSNLALSLIESRKTNNLLIPMGFTLERIEQIGAFVNFETEDIPFIYKLIQLASRTENGVKLIHVAANHQEAEQKNQVLHGFERLFSDVVNSGKVNFEVEIGSIPQIINSLKQKHNIDLMVIRSQNRHWNLYSSFSSFSDQVIRNIKCPLLVWKSGTSPKE